MLKTMYFQFKENDNVKLESISHIGDLYYITYKTAVYYMSVVVKTLDTVFTTAYLDLLIEKGFANIVSVRFTAIA